MKYRKIAELIELEKNPRKITEEKLQELASSIADNKKYFEARPIIVSDRTGKLVVIAGNQRLRAAKMLGLTEVPTHLISGLTEAKENEIVIRDNVHNGRWNEQMLNEYWDADELAGFGLDFEMAGEEEIFTPEFTPEFSGGKVSDEEVEKRQRELEERFKKGHAEKHEVVCPKCSRQFGIDLPK